MLSLRAERFVRDSIGSVQKLDCLVLLRTDRTRWWSAPAVAGELHAPADAIVFALEDLSSRNLLDVRLLADVVYRFAPWHHDVEAVMDEIVACCAENRDAIVSLLAPGPANAAG